MLTVESGVKRVAWTFDDGPNPPFSLEIAEFLDENDIPATFFQCGANIQQNPDITREIASMGFRIGNHSYDHSFWRTIAGFGFESIIETQRLIEDFAGKQTKIFRSPFGMTPPTVMKRLRRDGFEIAPAIRALTTADWKSGMTTEDIVERVLRRLRDGSIILLHDGDGAGGGRERSATVEAVKKLIPLIAEQGFVSVDLLELLSERDTRIFYP